MAQLVERTLGKGEVGGSNPPISTTTSFYKPHKVHYSPNNNVLSIAYIEI